METVTNVHNYEPGRHSENGIRMTTWINITYSTVVNELTRGMPLTQKKNSTLNPETLTTGILSSEPVQNKRKEDNTCGFAG